MTRPLDPTERYRCTGCGNVTRFDLVERSRVRRYHHFDLSGASRIDEEEVLDFELESVTCRWCGRSDSIAVEDRPHVDD
ncbi:MAG: hypothetical protein WD011_00525 [Nitriliruptoraceae bacterium]